MAADVYEVKAIGADNQGNQWQCTSHWLSTSLTPATLPYVEAEAIAVSYDAAISASFLNAVGPDINQHYIYATRVNNGGGNAFLYTVTGSGGFGSSSQVMGVGAQLRFLTASPRLVGKMFLPGISEGMFDNDVVTPAYLINLNALLSVLQIGFNTVHGPYLQVVWTTPKPHATPPVVGAPHDITVWGHADKPGAQRKRMVPLF